MKTIATTTLTIGSFSLLAAVFTLVAKARTKVHCQLRGSGRRQCGHLCDQHRCIERYQNAKQSSSIMQRMKRFLPLLPALRDAKHADHTKALDTLANDSGLPVSQWILIKDYKLSTDDAVRFLGGDGTDLIRQAMVLYLKKDKESFASTTRSYRTMTTTP